MLLRGTEHTVQCEHIDLFAQAKEAFARREDFQLHFLLGHPSQPAQVVEASSPQKRVAFFDGKLQNGGIPSPCKAAGKPSQSARSSSVLRAGGEADYRSYGGSICQAGLPGRMHSVEAQRGVERAQPCPSLRHSTAQRDAGAVQVLGGVAALQQLPNLPR